MPGDHAPNTPRKTPDKIRAPAGCIEVIKNVGTVFFNLRLQDFAQRCTPAQTMLTRPDSLNRLVITIGEKRPLRPLFDRQKNMSCRLSKIQKCVYLTGKLGTVFSQFANLRPQRRIVSGILEEPHKLGFSAIVSRWGKDSTDELYKGQAGLHGTASVDSANHLHFGNTYSLSTT
jgi:hypothetical protein